MSSFDVADRFCLRMKLSGKVVTIAIFKPDDITHLTADFFQEGKLKLLWRPEKKLVNLEEIRAKLLSPGQKEKIARNSEHCFNCKLDIGEFCILNSYIFHLVQNYNMNQNILKAF